MIDTLRETASAVNGTPEGCLGSLPENKCNREQNKGIRVLGLTAEYREARARALEELEGAGRWHHARARGLREKIDRIERCGLDVSAVGICACGDVRLVASRCGDRTACETCRLRAGRRALARSLRALPRMLGEARAAWNARGRLEAHRPGLRLLTLTTRHTGNVQDDRATIQAAWSRHRAWLDRRFNPRAARRAGLPRVRLRYVAAWEITPGRDGLGHAHLHVALISPRYDYAEARAAWRSHTDGGADTYSAVGSSGRSRSNGHAAARYVAKYVSKGLDTLPDALAAAWWCASYGRRSIAASRGAWDPREPCACGACGVVGDQVWSASRGRLEVAIAGVRARERGADPPSAPIAGLARWAVLC